MIKTSSADGTTLAIDRYGDGPSVVIVEGAFCHRKVSATLAELLAPRFTVYAYDRRGRGDSGDTPPYAVERELEDLAAVIREAGGSAFVYGMSSGAVLGLEAATRGIGVTRLALYEPPVNPDDEASRRAAELTAELTGLVAEGRRGDAAGRFIGITGIPEELIAGLRQSPMWPGMEAIAHTLPYDTTITGDHTVLRRAAGVGVPTLVAAGSNSGPYLLGAAAAVADAVPGARLETLAGQTHDVDYTLLAPLIAEFFSRP